MTDPVFDTPARVLQRLQPRVNDAAFPPSCTSRDDRATYAAEHYRTAQRIHDYEAKEYWRCILAILVAVQ